MSLSASSSTSGEKLASEPPSGGELDNSFLVLSQPIIWTYGVVALTFPFWPIYFSDIGLSESKIALLLAIGPVVALFAGQFWGYLADVRYNIRTCMVAMSVGTALLSALFPLLTGFAALLLLMALFAGMSNGRIAMVTAMVLDNRDGERRFGLLRTTGSVSFIIIGFIASILADRYDLLPLDLLKGWLRDLSPVVITFPLLVIVNLLVALSVFPVRDYAWGMRGKIQNHGEPAPTFLQVQRYLFTQPVIRAYIPFLLFSQLPHHFSHMMTSLLVVDELNGTTTQATLPAYIGAAAEIVIFLTFARISASIRLMPLFFIATIAQALRWALMYFWPTLPVIYMAASLHMFSYGLMYMCSVILFNRELPPAYRSSGQTLLNMMYISFGMTLGPLIGSVFLKMERFDLLDWYALSALLVCAGLPFWAMLKNRYNREHNVSGFWIRP